MEGRDFLELAKRMHISYYDEASARTIVSRSYYASFHQVKDFLSNNKINLLKSTDVHKEVYNYLLKSGFKDAIKLANDLSDMRKHRNNADYQLHFSKFIYNKDNCGLFYKKAEDFFKDFDNLNKVELLKGIYEFRRKSNN